MSNRVVFNLGGLFTIGIIKVVYLNSRIALHIALQSTQGNL